MNTIKSLVVATVIASSFITTGVASNIIEDTDVVKRIVVKMGHEDTSPIRLDTDENSWGGPEITHRWGVGFFPAFEVPTQDGDKRLSKIVLNMAALASDSRPQHLKIFFDLNDEPFHDDTYKNINPFQVSFNLPEDYAERNATFCCFMLDIFQPEKIDSNNKDPRTLGFMFTDIELE